MIWEKKKSSSWTWNLSPDSDVLCLCSNIKISFLHNSIVYPENVQLWCKIFLDVKCTKPFPLVVSLTEITWSHCCLSWFFADEDGHGAGPEVSLTGLKSEKALYSRKCLLYFLHEVQERGGETQRLSPRLISQLAPGDRTFSAAPPPDTLGIPHFYKLGGAVRWGQNWKEKRKSESKKVNMRRGETRDSKKREKRESGAGYGRGEVIFAAQCLQ